MTDVAEHIVDQREHDYSEEELAHAKKIELPVMIAKVDCVEHREVCMRENLMAYPTLRLFVDGERWKGGDYHGHRTVVEMADWLQQVEDKHKEDLGDEAKRNVQIAHQRTCNTIVLFWTVPFQKYISHRYSCYRPTPESIHRCYAKNSTLFDDMQQSTIGSNLSCLTIHPSEINE